MPIFFPQLGIFSSPQFIDLTLTGNLTVQGTTTTEDKNITIGNVPTPTDLTADGGGIILKGTNDISILWLDATNSWIFNQSIDLLANNLTTTGTVTAGRIFADSLQIDGNTLSSTNTDGDILLTPDGTGNVVVAGQIKVAGGSPGENKVLTSDATGLATWTTDFGTTVIQETFASKNVRFFGELALPATQGWSDTATGIATIDLFGDPDVFGEAKQVVRHNDDTAGGSTTSQIALTALDWIFINNNGASYSGVSRLDTTQGSNGFFVGLQANAAENPLATGNRRYGITFANDAGNLKVTDAGAGGGGTVTFDGISGRPHILFDEWFKWECVVPQLLDPAEFFINGILTTFAPIFGVNTGGLGTVVNLSSGSTGGTARVTYHDNFGVTIFEEGTVKTLAVATMQADVAQINIPEGKRDYAIRLPDGNPRGIGAVLRLVANNVGGSITLDNQNPITPEVLYNGLRQLEIDVFVKETIEGINTVNSGNVYIGFKLEDVDRTRSIFAQLTSSVDQNPADTNPTIITYNTQDAIAGIMHSTSVNPGEITIETAGIYYVSPQPQVGKTTGATKVDFDVFWQIDRGGGFIDEPNSNVKRTIKDSDITDVISSAFTIQLNVGDKIRMMQVVSSSTVGMGLKNTDPVVGPPTMPRTPSIILTMYRVGGIS